MRFHGTDLDRGVLHRVMGDDRCRYRIGQTLTDPTMLGEVTAVPAPVYTHDDGAPRDCVLMVGA